MSASAKRPPKAMLARAVRAAQLYCGSGQTLGIRDQRRLYNRMMAAAKRVADRAGIDVGAAAEQIAREAKRRGCITPTPGKDV
jgi:hypothetical protein